MIIILIALVFAGLAWSAFFSGAETGSYSVNAIRLRVTSERGSSQARRLQNLLEDREGLITVTLIGTNIANYLTTTFTAMLLSRAAAGMTTAEIEIYTTVILTPVVLVFGEILPKNLFRISADRLMLRCGLPLQIGYSVARSIGVLAALKWLSTRVIGWSVGNRAEAPLSSPRAEVLALLKEGVATGAVTDQQSELMDRVLMLASVPVGAAMVPLEDVVSVPPTVTRENVLAVIRHHPHTRYPVMDAPRRRVLGVLDAYEFLAAGRSTSERFQEEAIQLSPTASVANTLRRMREQQRTFGIVVDRWGNCIGVVTVKDLVEEIVGDLKAW